MNALVLAQCLPPLQKRLAPVNWRCPRPSPRQEALRAVSEKEGGGRAGGGGGAQWTLPCPAAPQPTAAPPQGSDLLCLSHTFSLCDLAQGPAHSRYAENVYRMVLEVASDSHWPLPWVAEDPEFLCTVSSGLGAPPRQMPPDRTPPTSLPAAEAALSSASWGGGQGPRAGGRFLLFRRAGTLCI